MQIIKVRIILTASKTDFRKEFNWCENFYKRKEIKFGKMDFEEILKNTTEAEDIAYRKCLELKIKINETNGRYYSADKIFRKIKLANMANEVFFSFKVDEISNLRIYDEKTDWEHLNKDYIINEVKKQFKNSDSIITLSKHEAIRWS
jgi:thioredoxin-related protein